MVQIAAREADRTERGLRQKRRILEAASRVFRQRGLHATGMREIAAELGMHVGNLYYYFRNKQDLLAFCQDDALSGLLERAREIRGLDLPADAKLARLIEAHVERLNAGTPGSLAHLEVEALEGELYDAIMRRRDAYEKLIRETIAEGIESGVFRDADPKVVSMAVLGAANWTVKWYRPEGGRAIEEIGSEFATLLVGGLLATAGRPA